MAKYKIVVTDNLFDNCDIEKDILSSIDGELEVYKGLSRDELIDVSRDADALLVNMSDIDGDFISSLDKCKVISRYGAGYDNVDTATAAKAGIPVAIVPDYCIEEVAEHAFALLLSLERDIAARAQAVREGRWRDGGLLTVKRIHGSVLGIIGYGRTGQALKRMASGFGFSKILVYSRGLTEGESLDNNVQSVSLERLLKESDYVSVHLPLNSETHHFINGTRLSLMKKDALLINTARGGVIDEAALYRVLSQGELRGAAIDVMEAEPPLGDNRLLELDNIVITDHRAFYSEHSVRLLKERCAENVRLVLTGEQPLFQV